MKNFSYAEVIIYDEILPILTLRKAIAAGDTRAFQDVFLIALRAAEKIETRFLNSWASTEEEIDNREILVSEAARRLTEATLFVFGWATGVQRDPYLADWLLDR